MTIHFHRMLAAAALFFALVAQTAVAEPRNVVVELFTSQGCSSCPPADALMHDLAERDDVIALSLHVDYWDYIGWKDAFADPAFSERQRQYAVVAGRSSVYTPQMIVNGETSVVGARAMKLVEAIETHKAAPGGIDVTLEKTGGQLRVSAPATSVDAPMVVQMLRYQPARSVDILRGENAGRSWTYVNVAQDWRVLSEWSGDEALSLEVALEGDLPVVVLVQAINQGPILGAAQLR